VAKEMSCQEMAEFHGLIISELTIGMEEWWNNGLMGLKDYHDYSKDLKKIVVIL
jgi:hypothetical protein